MNSKTECRTQGIRTECRDEYYVCCALVVVNYSVAPNVGIQLRRRSY